jgi:putative transposase
MQKLPSLQPGKYYHIYNRGINRENIFIEEKNYHYFLKLYAKYIEPVADTFAYCLLRNHFHLSLRIKDSRAENLSDKFALQQFTNFFNSYAKSINKAYNRTGSLFQSRFGRIEVTTDRYFIGLIAYIHYNPQKHRFVDDYRTYPYSSYNTYLSDKPTSLGRNEALLWFSGRERFAEFHSSFIESKTPVKLIGDDDD